MTPKQNELYQWLLARADNPISPTYSEMASAMQLKSKSNINRLIGALEAQGMVKKSDRKSRTVRAIPPGTLDGVPTVALIAELKRRGEWHGA